MTSGNGSEPRVRPRPPLKGLSTMQRSMAMCWTRVMLVVYIQPISKGQTSCHDCTSESKFKGQYDRWLQIRQRYNSKWSSGNELLQSFSRFFDDGLTLDSMLQRIGQMLRTLPSSMSLTFRNNAFLFFILPLSASAIKKKGTNREKEESLRSSGFDTSLREGVPTTPLCRASKKSH